MVCNRRSIICFGCRLVHGCKYRTSVGCKWEFVGQFHNSVGIYGTIFSDTIDMRNTINMEHSYQSENAGKGTRWLLVVSEYLHSIFATIKKDFQDRNMAWKVTDILGMTSILYSFLDGIFNKDFFSAMPSGFRFSMYIFALGYFVLVLLRAYERYRSEKLENDKKQFLWSQRKKLIQKRVEAAGKQQ